MFPDVHVVLYEAAWSREHGTSGVRSVSLLLTKFEKRKGFVLVFLRLFR